MKLDKNKSDSRLDKVILIFVFVLVMLGMWWLYSSTQNKGEKIEADVVMHNILDSKSVSVEYRVTNTTDEPGYSDCEISMYDESREHSGTDFGFKSTKEIQPGEEYNGVARLEISNNGAEKVTKQSITCTLE